MEVSSQGGHSAPPNNEIWVLAEASDGCPAGASYELLSKANELAKAKGSSIAVVAAGQGVSSWAPFFEGKGVSRMYVWDSPLHCAFHEELIAEGIAAAAKMYRPETILGPATVRGRSLLPRLAVLLETGLTADCTRLEIDESTGKLLQTRPAFGGNLLATIVSERFPQMSTVRPHVFSKDCKEPLKVSSRIGIVDISPSASHAPLKRLLSWKGADGGSASLSDASCIVAVGMGIGGPKGVEMAGELASRIGGALAASRSVVDSGWLDYARQVGQTGITVHPKIYLACGISGAIQHLVGMQDSSFIIAINRDPEAPIFSVADLAVCADLSEALPLIVSKL